MNKRIIQINLTKSEYYQLQDDLSKELFNYDYNDLSRASKDYINEITQNYI